MHAVHGVSNYPPAFERAVHTRGASRAAGRPPSLPGVSARSPTRSDAASREPMQQGAAQVARHEGGGVARIEARWRRLEQERERDEQAATVLWAAELEAARRDAFVLVPARDIVVHEDAPHYAPKLSRKRLRERRAARKEKAQMRLRLQLSSAAAGQARRQRRDDEPMPRLVDSVSDSSDSSDGEWQPSAAVAQHVAREARLLRRLAGA